MKTCPRLARPGVVSFLALLFLLCGVAFATRGGALPSAPTLDARIRWTAADGSPQILYRPDQAYEYLSGMSDGQRALYAWSEVTVDMVFPLVYTGLLLALLCMLARSPEAGRPGLHPRWRAIAVRLAVAGGAFDILENASVARLAFVFPGTSDVTALAAAAFTALKFLCLVGAALTALAVAYRAGRLWYWCGLLWLWAMAFTMHSGPVLPLVLLLALAVVAHAKWAYAAQYLYFLRFPIGAGMLLAFLPQLVGAKGATSLFGNLLVLEGHFFVVSFLGTLVALTVMSMTRLAFLTAAYRAKLPFWRPPAETHETPGSAPATPGDPESFAEANTAFVSEYCPWLIRGRVPVFALLVVPLLLGIWRVSSDPPVGDLVLGWLTAIGLGMVLQLLVEPWLHEKWTSTWDEITGWGIWSSKVLKPVFAVVGRLFEGFARKGHAPIVMMAIAALIAYATVSPLRGWEHSRLIANSFPPILYVFLVSGALIWLTTIVSLIFDRSRVPVTFAGVVWLTVAYGISGSDHFYRIVPDSGAMTLLPTPTEAVEARRAAPGTGDYITVVAASGGGIKASLWTATVMKGLQDSVGSDLTRSIVLMSTNSGGSAGAMYYTDAFEPTGVSLQRLGQVVDAAGESSLSAVVWGMAYPDVWRIVTGGLLPGKLWPTRDRGWAMDRRWERIRASRLQPSAAVTVAGSGAVPARPRRLSDWVPGVREGWRPAHIFNATSVETGAAVRIATVAMSDPEPGSGREPRYARGSEPREFADLYPGADIDVATAARLSASFPWVSPMARPWVSPDDLQSFAAGYSTLVDSAAFHLGDGGYFDNFGVFSAVDFLRRVDAAALEGDSVHPVRRVVFVEIRATPEGEGRPDRGGFKYSAFGPLLAMAAVRNSSQIGRNDEELELLRDEWAHRGITVCRVVFSLERPGPLSWHLSSEERTTITNAWSGLPSARARVLREYLERPDTDGATPCPSGLVGSSP